jgi:hypothetical protein
MFMKRVVNSHSIVGAVYIFRLSDGKSWWQSVMPSPFEDSRVSFRACLASTHELRGDIDTFKVCSSNGLKVYAIPSRLGLINLGLNHEWLNSRTINSLQ